MDIYELLTRELGADRVLRDDRIERFLSDESGLGRYPAAAAVLPESVDEVALVLRLAREHRVPVTPRGAGSGLTGGCLPHARRHRLVHRAHDAHQRDLDR